MSARSPQQEKAAGAARDGDGDAVDAQLVGSMRLALALFALVFNIIDPSGLHRVTGLTWLILSMYVTHSAVLYLCSWLHKPFAQGKSSHWLDVGWYGLIILASGGVSGYFYLFFFFPILTCSFRWGFGEGVRITGASVLLFISSGLVSGEPIDLPRILMRTTFLLALGYMAAHWGQSKVELKRRVALLRDVSRLSNPRFGVDHTIASVLEKTRQFFGGSSCVLLMRDNETGDLTLRTVRGAGPLSLKREAIGAAASPLLALPAELIVLYARPLVPALSLFGGSLGQDNAREKWVALDAQQCFSLAEILDAHSFISAPIHMRKEAGRVYVLSRRRNFSKADAVFLGHIVGQAFPVIENIELLDRMVSEAASQERRRIALDLHDTAIQPYIGLKMGLSALRQKAAADNPLIDDLDKLSAMAAEEICDLRRYAGMIRDGARQADSVLLADVHQQVAQMRKFYGIDIAIGMDGEFSASDRLSAELLQIVREGLSNIRKHTMAASGAVHFQSQDGWLKIRIENDGVGKHDFTPRSITERVTALGGKAHAMRGVRGMTVVYIEIPA
ncbi:MAG TPA: histidine kinase [Janthinobacterium sp.]|jgi:signal transduction histidine kinase|nr:histidine kinase [Janthinobacterium sp.]